MDDVGTLGASIPSLRSPKSRSLFSFSYPSVHVDDKTKSFIVSLCRHKSSTYNTLPKMNYLQPIKTCRKNQPVGQKISLLPTALNVLRPIFLPVFVTNLLHPLFLFQISLATDCRSKKTTRNCYNCREVVQGKRLQNFFLLQPMTSYITAVFIKLGHSRPLFHLFMCFSSKNYNVYNNIMWKLSIQYPTLAFEPTTPWTGVSLITTLPLRRWCTIL